MEKTELEVYIERSQSLLESSPQMAEENTKVKLIQPLIELLDWNVYSSEVELEYPIQIGRGNTRADYALLLEGAPVIFVEAKGSDTTLSDSDRSQLASYMRQKGVDWGLLTNGNEFEILKRREESPRPDETVLAEFELKDLSENWSVLKLLSRGLIETGEAQTIANQIEARKHAIRQLRANKEDTAERITQVLTERTGETLIQEIQSESKKFIDELIQSLSQDLEGEITLPTTTNEMVSEPSKVDVYGIEFSKEETAVQSFRDSSQANVMADAVGFLVNKYDLMDKFDSLPYVPGKTNAILNSEPVHPSGKKMRLFRKLPQGYYLYVSLNKESKQRYVTRFANWCGLEAVFAGNW